MRRRLRLWRGLAGIAGLVGWLIAGLAGPALAQFKVDDPTTLAARLPYLMPAPDQVMRQNAKRAQNAQTPTAKEQRAKGMAEAPALIQEAGLNCRLSDARWIAATPAGRRRLGHSWYEIACVGDLGYILEKPSIGAARAATCLEMSVPTPRGRRNDLRCILPENLDPRIGLAPYIARTGEDCPPERVREIGHSDTQTAFELACRDGDGFIMTTSTPPRLDKPIEIEPCFAYPASGALSCIYTDRRTQMARVDALVSQAGIPCTVKERAYIGQSNRDGASFWEAACQDGRGWLLKQGLDGRLAKAVDCAEAASVVAGGCQLTDSRAARADRASQFAREAEAAGFPCKVSDYARFVGGAAEGSAVELACADHAAGGVLVSSPTHGPSVVDCAHAQLMGYDCRLSRVSAAYADLTSDLLALGKTACTVSDSRAVGVTPDHHAYAEVACADGYQGYMIEYQTAPLIPVQATVCAQARHIGAGCTLPENRPR